MNGFDVGGFVNEGVEKEIPFLQGGTAAVPSIYSPFMATTAVDSHKRTFLALKVGMIHSGYNQNPTSSRIVLHGKVEYC